MLLAVVNGDVIGGGRGGRGGVVVGAKHSLFTKRFSQRNHLSTELVQYIGIELSSQ